MALPPLPPLFSEGFIINNITPAAGDAEPVQIRMIWGATNNYSVNDAYNFLLDHQNNIAKISWSHRTDNHPHRRDIHRIMDGSDIIAELAYDNPHNINYTLDPATRYLVLYEEHGLFLGVERISQIHRIPPAPAPPAPLAPGIAAPAALLNGGYYQKYLKYKSKYLNLKNNM